MTRERGKNKKKGNTKYRSPKQQQRNSKKEEPPSTSSGEEKEGVYFEVEEENKGSYTGQTNRSPSPTKKCRCCAEIEEPKTFTAGRHKKSSSKSRRNRDSGCYDDDDNNEKRHNKASKNSTTKGIRKRLITISSSAFEDTNRMPIMLSTDTSEMQSLPTDAKPPKQSCDCRSGKSKHPWSSAPKRQNNRSMSKHRNSQKNLKGRGGRSSNCCKSPLNRPTSKMKNRCKNNNNSKRKASTVDDVDVSYTLPSCPICCKEFSSPILLSCSHTFCKECVSVFVEASDGCSFSCPVCEIEIILQGEEEELFCPNFMVLKQMEDDEDDDGLLCGVCESDNEADFFCVQCSDLLCEDCADAHHVVKYTRDHSVKEITCDTNLSKFIKKRYYCNDHENEQLDIYCERCEKSICRECALESHRSEKHNCIPLKLAAQTCRDDTQRQLYDIKSRSPNLQLALMKVKNQKKMLRDQANATYAEISESFRRIMSALKEHERKLYKTLEETYRKKLRTLKSEKEKVVLKLERFATVSSMLDELESHDNEVEVLQMKCTIKEAVDNLSSDPVDFEPTLNTTAVLFKSNESAITEALATHGDIIKIKGGDRGRISKNVNKLSIACDFSDQTNSLSSHECDNESEASTINNDINLRSSAKKMRAKSNWGIVKSRIHEIASNIQHRQRRRGSKASLLSKKKEMSEARKQKARANWLILRSHLNELTTSSATKKQQQQRGKRKGSKQTTSLSRTFNKLATRKRIHAKAMRSRAIRQRAAANWLLVRSKLPEIVIFGKVSGRLFTPLTIPTMYQKRKRTSPTMTKLKYFRAKKLRARANWLLVSSRLHDIVNYPNKQKLRKDKVTWDIYRPQLETQRERAGRNKYVAGKLRGITNWLIVKARLSDVILFGKYEHYRRLETPSNKSRSRTPSLTKQRRQSYGKSEGPATNAWPDVRRSSRSSTSSKKTKFCSKKKKSAFKNWDKLIRKAHLTKRHHTPDNNKKPTNNHHSSKSIKRKDSSEPVKRKSSQGSSKQPKSVANWNDLIQGTQTDRSIKKHGLKNWDRLIAETSVKQEPTSLNQWDSLIAETEVKKKSDSLKNWDKLMTETSVKKQLNSLKNWDKLINETADNKKSSSLKNWNKLINATDVKAKSISLKNWDKFIAETSVKKQSNSLKTWDKLINETSVKKKSSNPNNWNELTDDTDVKPKSNSLKNWNKLISKGQDKKKSIADDTRIKSNKTATKNQIDNNYKDDDESVGKWNDLIKGEQKKVTEEKIEPMLHQKTNSENITGFDNARNGDDDQSFEKWDKLINGTSAPSTMATRSKERGYSGENYQSTSLDPDLNSLSEKHWQQLAHCSKYEKPEAEKHWDKLVSNASAEKKKAEWNWLQLVHQTKSKTRHPTEKARERWLKVRESLGRYNSKDELNYPRPRSVHDMDRKTKETAYTNWWRLISGTKTPKRSGKKSDAVKKAVRNWNTLLSGTEIKASPYEGWKNLIQGTQKSK